MGRLSDDTSKRVELRVEGEELKGWQKAADEDGGRTLASLIRRAVRAYLKPRPPIAPQDRTELYRTLFGLWNVPITYSVVWRDMGATATFWVQLAEVLHDQVELGTPLPPLANLAFDACRRELKSPIVQQCATALDPDERAQFMFVVGATLGLTAFLEMENEGR